MSRVRLVLSISLGCVLAACSTPRLVDSPTQNRSSRIDHVVIHFTGERFAESLRLLTERTENPVSAHYLVPESGDPTYPRRRLRVHRLVDEEDRAWHAGDSFWRGATALNARSIGIEIVNRSRCEIIEADALPAPSRQRCEFVEFDPEQLELVAALLHGVLGRYPRIDPIDIVGHADIAPGRRADPGPTFPWRWLHEQGIGAWYDDATAARYRERFAAAPLGLASLQRALGAYGYRVAVTGELDPATRFALRAFQMHFRPSDWSGEPDPEIAAILFALLEKYRPEALAELEAAP